MTKLTSVPALATGSLLSLLAVGCGDSGGTTGTGSTSGGDGCSPDVGCPTVQSDCIAFVDNSAKDTFALRISNLSITAPVALTDPTVAALLAKGVNLDYPECKAATGDAIFTGDGTFSWILEFNKTDGTLRTGGAVLEADPNAGYCFVNQMIDGFQVEPLVTNAPLGADGSFEITENRDVVVPIYTTPGDTTSVILLPLRGVRLFDAKVSADNNCIGAFNVDGLDPNNLCLADNQTPQFLDGASLEGYVTLEEADQVTVPTLGNASLCTLLAKDPMYVDATGKKCLRDGMGKITFTGDWCDATNAAADATCKDSVKLAATLAASGVALRTDCPVP